MKRIALTAAVALMIAMPLLAQTRLPAGARVRLALPQGQMIEGSVVRGDSISLTVRTDAGSVEVPRERILLITTSSAFNGQRAFQSGLIAAGVGALTIGAITTECRPNRDCRPSYGAMTTVAVLGAAFGSAVAGGASGGQWMPVSTSAPVVGGAFAREGGTCDARPSARVNGGLSTARSHTIGAAVSLFCYQRMSLGLEGGMVRDLTLQGAPVFESQQQGVPYSYYSGTTTHRSYRRRASFMGMLGDLPIGGPLEPRLLVSAGAYRRTDAVETKTTSFSYNPAVGSGGGEAELLAGSSLTYTMPGIGAGLAVYGPATSNLAIGVTARVHYLLGYTGGAIGTLEATARIR